MSSTPTAALTFEDLILTVARKLGLGYYGPSGDDRLQVPVDLVDLQQCKDIVNNAIRMFIADCPKASGWRWTELTSEIVLWPSTTADPANTISAIEYDSNTGQTLVQVQNDSFYESMEEHPLTVVGLTGPDSEDEFVIAQYVSATEVNVYGDASAVAALEWYIESTGNVTLPRFFGGSYTGTISYTQDTDPDHDIQWANETEIRRWREGDAQDTGDPWIAAVRTRSVVSGRRRWELMVYPDPDEVLRVEFPFQLYFDELVAFNESPPCPFEHDDTLIAACLARAEKDFQDELGIDWNAYHQKALANSMRIDNRSAPKRISERTPYRWVPGQPVPGYARREDVRFINGQ